MIPVAWSPLYNHPLPAGHRFPMLKYDLIREQLAYEGLTDAFSLFEPSVAPDKAVRLVHSKKYVAALYNLSIGKSEERKIGFPLSSRLIHREWIIAGGTLSCALQAITTGVALNISGGTHHAFSEHGEGFCLLNDVAIAAAWCLYAKLANRVLIIDLDVHQGNGTARIFQDETRVFTFSMHGADNYPHKPERSDRDVALPSGATDDLYNDLLGKELNCILSSTPYDLVFYIAGADILSVDKLGRLALTHTGAMARDHIVLQACRRLCIPVVVVMGGGYAPRIADVVNAHLNTFRVARSIYG